MRLVAALLQQRVGVSLLLLLLVALFPLERVACFSPSLPVSLSSTNYVKRNTTATTTLVLSSSSSSSSAVTTESLVPPAEDSPSSSSSSAPSSSPSSSPIHTLILTRHGDSIWNGGQPGTQETFTGWTDVPLSEKGVLEAQALGAQIAAHYHHSSSSVGSIDVCFSSILQRAQCTAHYCMWAFFDSCGHFEQQQQQQRSHHPQRHQTTTFTPARAAPQKYVMDYRLNERHYGSLQGLVKQDLDHGGIVNGQYYDARDVQAWRRKWHAVPPLLSPNDPRRVEEIRKYLHYCEGKPENVPMGESLAMVAQNRIRPFIHQVLTPVLNEAAAAAKKKGSGGGNHRHAATEEGATGLIVAHANSLRALIGVLCQVEEERQHGGPASLERLEAIKIPTGVPLVLRYRQLGNGAFEICEIPGLDGACADGMGKGGNSNKILPHLPIWPLSAIPRTCLGSQKNRQLCSNDDYKVMLEERNQIGDAAIMGKDLVRKPLSLVS